MKCSNYHLNRFILTYFKRKSRILRLKIKTKENLEFSAKKKKKNKCKRNFQNKTISAILIYVYYIVSLSLSFKKINIALHFLLLSFVYENLHLHITKSTTS